MIRSFADKETERVRNGERSRRFPPDIQQRAFRLLKEMARVRHWTELRHPPSNKLHALHRDRAGQYAIRINDQWRIAFRPDGEALADVEITDYH